MWIVGVLMELVLYKIIKFFLTDPFADQQTNTQKDDDCAAFMVIGEDAPSQYKQDIPDDPYFHENDCDVDW